jgi:hypothetical protein
MNELVDLLNGYMSIDDVALSAAYGRKLIFGR